MYTFNTTKLAGTSTLVEIVDAASTVVGAEVLNNERFEAAKARLDQVDAVDEVQDELRKLYAPVLKAAKKARKAANRPTDPDAVVVISEGSDTVKGQAREEIVLDEDGIILRLIEEGRGNELTWVKDLGILRLAPTAVEDDEDDEDEDDDSADVQVPTEFLNDLGN